MEPKKKKALENNYNATGIPDLILEKEDIYTKVYTYILYINLKGYGRAEDLRY